MKYIKTYESFSDKVIPLHDEVEPSVFTSNGKSYLQGGVMNVDPDDLWKYRHIRNNVEEYDNVLDWNGEGEWRKRVDELKESFKTEGIKEALILNFDREGYAWLGEGNHRLVAARELKSEGYDIKVPIRTYFQGWSSSTKNTESPARLFEEEVIDNAERVSKERHYHFNYLAPQSSVLA